MRTPTRQGTCVSAIRGADAEDGLPSSPMLREIVDFRRDAEGQWIAELSCGHSQHVRHEPPFQVRPWVLDEASRKARLGTQRDCPLCDEPASALSGG